MKPTKRQIELALLYLGDVLAVAGIFGFAFLLLVVTA